MSMPVRIFIMAIISAMDILACIRRLLSNLSRASRAAGEASMVAIPSNILAWEMYAASNRPASSGCVSLNLSSMA